MISAINLKFLDCIYSADHLSKESMATLRGEIVAKCYCSLFSTCSNCKSKQRKPAKRNQRKRLSDARKAKQQSRGSNNFKGGSNSYNGGSRGQTGQNRR